MKTKERTKIKSTGAISTCLIQTREAIPSINMENMLTILRVNKALLKSIYDRYGNVLGVSV